MGRVETGLLLWTNPDPTGETALSLDTCWVKGVGVARRRKWATLNFGLHLHYFYEKEEERGEREREMVQHLTGCSDCPPRVAGEAAGWAVGAQDMSDCLQVRRAPGSQLLLPPGRKGPPPSDLTVNSFPSCKGFSHSEPSSE